MTMKYISVMPAIRKFENKGDFSSYNLALKGKSYTLIE